MNLRSVGSVRRAELGVWIAGVAFGLMVGLLDWGAKGWAAPLMVAGVAGLGGYYIRALGWRAGVLLVLIVASLADRYTFRVGPADIRAEEIAGLGALVVLAATRFRARAASWLKPDLSEVVLLGWFACSVLSSLLASPDKRLSAKIIALVAVCSLGYFLPRRILAGPGAAEQLERVVRWLLIAFATESAWGSAAYLLHAFGPTISITPNPASGHLSAYGTLWEQNVFGAVAAAGAVAWVYLWPGRFNRAWIWLAVCISALIDSLTRAAWLAAALMALIGVVLPGLRRRLDMVTVGRGMLGGLLAAGAVLVVDSFGSYTVPVAGAPGVAPKQGLFGAIFNMTDFIGRLNQTSPVWSDIHGRNVLLGRGTASFEVLHQVKGVAEHVASLPLLILNDTGVLGLLLFATFVVSVFVRAWKRRHDGLTLGLGQVALVMLLGSLATQTTELMIGWLLVGILMAAHDLAPATEAIRTQEPLRADAA